MAKFLIDVSDDSVEVFKSLMTENKMEFEEHKEADPEPKKDPENTLESNDILNKQIEDLAKANKELTEKFNEFLKIAPAPKDPDNNDPLDQDMPKTIEQEVESFLDRDGSAVKEYLNAYGIKEEENNGK